MGRPRKMTPEDARKILEELASRCPVRRFINELSTDTQRDILFNQAVYNLVDSANQGGKTTTAIVDCAAKARGIHPGVPWFGPVKILVIVPSRAQASAIWGKRLLECSDIRAKVTSASGAEVDLSREPLIPKGEIAGVSYSVSPQGKYPGKITLKNGSEIIMFLSGATKGWERLQGIAFDLCYRDEAVGNEDLGNEVFPRLLAAQTAVQKGLRPWGGSIMWVATATLINTEFEAFRQRCIDAVPGYKRFWIDPKENPGVSVEVREGMRASMSDHAAAVRLDGTAGAMDDVVIFRHQLDQDRHRMSVPYTPTPQDNIWVGWDPGWDHPFGLVFAAISPDNPMRLTVWKAINGRKRTLDHIANEIATTLNGRMVEAFVFDPAAKKTEHSRGTSVAYQMEQLLDQMGVRAYRGILYGRNRYEDTIPAMARYFDPSPNDKTVEPLIRIAGDPATGFNGCGQVWEQLCKYRRKPTTTQLRGHNIHKHDDEFVDLIRYIISREPSWSARPPNHPNSVPMAEAELTLRPAASKPDPLAIHPDMPDDVKLHRMRLQESSRSIGSLMGTGPRSLGTGYLNW